MESCNAGRPNEPLFSSGSGIWPGLVSCNAKEPYFLLRSSACANIISCNGSPIKAGFRQYPGFFARHAWTRSTCCSPRKYSWLSALRSQRRWLDCLLAVRHAGSEQYFWRWRRRGSRLNSFWQHRHRRRRGLVTRSRASGPMEDPNHAENCAVGRRRVSLCGDSHRRFHPHRCRHGIVISIPADAKNRSRSRWNRCSRSTGIRVHDALETAFTIDRNMQPSMIF